MADENETAGESGAFDLGTAALPRAGGRPSGGGPWAGMSIALLLGMRSVVPLMRSVGPIGRHGLVWLLVGAAPVAIGAEVFRRRAARRNAQARIERARARAARGTRTSPENA